MRVTDWLDFRTTHKQIVKRWAVNVRTGKSADEELEPPLKCEVVMKANSLDWCEVRTGTRMPGTRRDPCDALRGSVVSKEPPVHYIDIRFGY